MKKILVLVLLCKASLCFAQFEKNFTPSAFLDTIPPKIYHQLKNRLDADKAKIAVKGKAGSFTKTLYDQRFDYLVKTFNEDYILTQHPIADFINGIVNKIYDANPQLPREAIAYIFRSESPNAVSFGEGTLCVMLGLMERLETEDQVAFVLCHELAHYHAGHAEKRIAELTSLNYDKELKQKIDAVMSSPYGRYSKMKQLFNTLDMSVTRHSRQSETEADSIGLTYYLRTTYNPLAALRCMQILDQADKGVYRNNIDFKKYFDFKDFPFKPSWAAYTKSNIWYAPPKDGDTDTLKTHPNCKKRFNILKRHLGIPSPDSSQLFDGKKISALNHLASFEVISTHYHYRQYGKSLFYAMLLAEQYPDNAYAHAMIGKNLYQLYKAQKSHTLGKVLEMPDPRFDENYDRFLTFVHSLRLFELAHLAYEYVTTRPVAFYNDEEFIHALWLCSRFEFSKLDADKVKEEYASLFPNGKYLDEMKSNKLN